MDEAGLKTLLFQEEDYDIEYKLARSSFSKNKLNDYCAAIANENGGYLLLGITNEKVIRGTSAFTDNWNRLARQLTNELNIRIQVYQILTNEGRVLCFEIPPHPTATPILSKGGTGGYRYPIRDGESLTEMRVETLHQIIAERDDDWSADTVSGMDISKLNSDALDLYQQRWATFTNDPSKLLLSHAEMLETLHLTVDKSVTNAALLLFGNEDTLDRYIPDAEIIFEWRNEATDIAYGDRKNWRAGFLSIEDVIWNTINARNSNFRYQEGFTQRNIAAFNEDAIREAVINAFAHRDYTLTGRSIVIKASPTQFLIENPGRLMPGITLDNILDRSEWRNRRLAEALEKVNIMERSGQGVDKIFRTTIEDGKGLPTISVAPDPSITLTIPAVLRDQEFINFLASVANRHQISFSVREIVELEYLRQEIEHPPTLNFKDRFLELGIIERVGYGRGSRYILSHNYYKTTNNTGRHMRLTGLARDVKRQTIVGHLNKNKKVTNMDLQKAMPEMSVQEVYQLLHGMKKDGIIEHHGSNRYGYWILSKTDENE